MRKFLDISSVFVLFGCLFLGACHGDPEPADPVCGNGVLENGEFCDGDQFGGATCVSEGFETGSLVCTATCALDTSACVPRGCGDGLARDGEPCDGTDLRGQTCADRGWFGGGALACDDACFFDLRECELGSDDQYTSGLNCEVGRPCQPFVVEYPWLPRVCAWLEDPRLRDPVSYCLFSCERHEDCRLGEACVENDGVRWCEPETCETPFAPCTLSTGHPGLCTPVGDAMQERNLCQAAGLRQLGEACTPPAQDEVGFAFEFDPETRCESGVCGAAGVPPGTCAETLCDAVGVLEGRVPDPCPDGFNCMNMSKFLYISEYGPGEPELIRTADVGACVPQEMSTDRWSGRVCHALTGLQTKSGEPCPTGSRCYGTLMGTLQGFCMELGDGPELAEGEVCGPEDGNCETGTTCTMADPFTVTDFENHDRACRRPCDATVFADNPACDGLPEGTTWVCLSVSRFYTEDHELRHVQNEFYDYVETHPARLGYCVPDRL